MASSDWYTIHYLQLVRTTPAKDDCMIIDGKEREMASYISFADLAVILRKLRSNQLLEFLAYS